MRADASLLRLLMSDRVSVVLISLHVIAWVMMPIFLVLTGRFPTEDVARLVEIHDTPGVPYKDFLVEYAPLETLLARSVFVSETVGEAFMVVLNAGATLGSFVVVRRTWSRSVGNMFLLYSLPLQVFMPFHVDAAPTFLALVAVVLARTQRHAASGLSLATAILFRLWPFVVVPTLASERKSRAIPVALVLTLAGAVVWLFVGGTEGIRQVVAFRGATGWHVESMPGVLLSLSTDRPARFEQGAFRIGSLSPWALLIVGSLVAVLLVLIWTRARRTSVDPAGMPATAAVASLLAFSPLFSPQFVAWLLPWAAIGSLERMRWSMVILTLGAVCSTALGMIAFWTLGVGATFELLAFARLSCVWGLVAIWLLEHPRSSHPDRDFQGR